MADAPSDNPTLSRLLKLREEIDAQIKQKYRQSAALLVVDLIGSTAFYEQFGDEIGKTSADRALSLGAAFVQPNGRVVKTMGDGFFALFHNPTAAFEVAHQLVDKLEEERGAHPEVPQMAARAALHWGDLFIQNDDLFGDVVNTAARLIDLMKMPIVLMSSAFVDQLPVSTRSSCVQVGSFEVKGKGAPLAVFTQRGNSGDEMNLEEGTLWAYHYDPTLAACLRLVTSPLWPASAQAIACSHSSFRNNYQRLAGRRHSRAEGQSWTLYDLSVGSSAFPCWVYDFDAMGSKVEGLVAAYCDWATQTGLQEIALRLPHRLKALELWVATETAAATWIERLPISPQGLSPRTLWLSYPEASPTDKQELAFAAARGFSRGETSRIRVEVRADPECRGRLSSSRMLLQDAPPSPCWFEASATRAERRPLEKPSEIEGT